MTQKEYPGNPREAHIRKSSKKDGSSSAFSPMTDIAIFHAVNIADRMLVKHKELGRSLWDKLF
jgi:hypothetical protein